MQAPRTTLRGRLSVLVALVLAFTGLQAFLMASPANANLTPLITLPYSEDWSNDAKITANDNWSGVDGVIGYRGDDLTAAQGTNPQTCLLYTSPSPRDRTRSRMPSSA